MQADTHGNRRDLNAFSGPGERDAKPDEFEDFFLQQYPILTSWLIQLGANFPDAQDIAQEVFITAFQHWDRIERPSAWIRVVATRALSRRKAQAARLSTVADFPDYYLPPSRDAIESRMEIAGVLESINSLPPTQRAVMAMYIDGTPISGIASKLQISPSTVRVHLHSARQRLKKLLALDKVDGQDVVRGTR
jgi:RNA polymerase sigma factor (sigma-70 family)